MLSLFVVGVCWLVAASLWYMAGHIENKSAKKRDLSDDLR
jgi:hypothetical protein